MSRQEIRDEQYRVIGTIQPIGDRRLEARDSRYRTLGTYDGKTDETRDANGRRTKGNRLEVLIALASQEEKQRLHDDEERKKREKTERERQENERREQERRQQGERRRQEQVARDQRERQENERREQQRRQREEQSRQEQVTRDQRERARRASEQKAKDEKEHALQVQRDREKDSTLRAAEARQRELVKQNELLRAEQLARASARDARFESDTAQNRERRRHNNQNPSSRRPATSHARPHNPVEHTDSGFDLAVTNSAAVPARSSRVGTIATLVVAVGLVAWWIAGGRPQDPGVPGGPTSDPLVQHSGQTEALHGQAEVGGQSVLPESASGPAREPAAAPAEDPAGSNSLQRSAHLALFVLHRHGRSKLTESKLQFLGEYSRPPSGFCLGRLQLTETSVAFSTADSSDDRRDNLLVGYSNIKTVELKGSQHLRVETSGSGDWDFFANEDSLRDVVQSLEHKWGGL